MLFRRREPGSGPASAHEAGLADRIRGGARTVIGSQTRFRGSLRGRGAVLVCGSLRGDIDLDGGLVIAPGAIIEAEVAVESVRVSGRLRGSVRTRSTLRVDPTGEIEGDVATPVIDLRPGSRIQGRASIAGSAPAGRRASR